MFGARKSHHCLESSLSPLDPSYLRSEPNNRLSVLSSDGKQIYTILNRVAKEILDLCDGTCDLPKILRLFQEKYPDQPRETLAHDLAQTLHSLTVNCLIVWKKEGRYMNDPFGSDYLTSVDNIGGSRRAAYSRGREQVC